MKQSKENFNRRFQFKFFTLLSLILISMNTRSQNKIVRKEIYTANIGGRVIKKVDVREIKLSPGQKTWPHKHPCPVVSYIVSGSVLFQVEGDSLQTLKAGEVVYEPADTPILRFDNASSTKPLIFIPYYLINDEKELIEKLPSRQ